MGETERAMLGKRNPSRAPRDFFLLSSSHLSSIRCQSSGDDERNEVLHRCGEGWG